ncbi:MAG: succinylglutamate desuccinylase/aspartoacylase family protein [Myxococcota bacterium]
MDSSAPELRVGGVRVEPGERATVDLPVAGLYTHGDLTMPVRVVRGKKPGPTLFVSAAIHGDEINGVEIIRRLLKMRALRRLRGTLLAVPVVNVFGFIGHSRYLPDRRDLNRSFPGSGQGSLASRLAELFLREVVAKSTHGIDLHTAAVHRSNLPQLRVSLAVPGVEPLAHAFGAPVVLDANVRDGSLRSAVYDRGVPLLVYEGGEALRFDEVAIRVGLRGVVGVMHALGMLPTPPSKPRKPMRPLVAKSSSWVRAPESGVLRTRSVLGALVEEGTVLGTIGDPFGDREIEVRAPASGLVVGRLHLPLVNEGDALFHVARFDEDQQMVEAIEAFQAEYELRSLVDPSEAGT